MADAEVVAIMAEELAARGVPRPTEVAGELLADLSAVGARVLYVPEGVEVAHGAKLVKEQIVEVRPYERRWSFTIEDKP